ncbi:hypothetical protein D3C78_1224290 [compost metagenome]
MVLTSLPLLPLLLLLFAFILMSGCGKVRTVPSTNTKVMLLTWPRTHDNVQSPLAVPETIAPSTSGSSMPFAVRLSLPIISLNG